MGNVSMMDRKTIIAGRNVGRARVSVKSAPLSDRLSLRAPQDSVATLSKSLGFDLPQKPKTSADGMGVTALWLGPDEWYLFASDSINPAGKVAGANVFHSAVDISHRNVGIMVQGKGAADVINAGCPQDLSLTAFPVGACSRTMLGKSEIILLRTDVDAFRIEVWRSFATYAFDFLEEVARLDIV